MSAALLPVLLASAAGSVHCAGMCGGLIAASAGPSPVVRERWLGQLAYQSGRFAAYVTLGALAGALGHALDLAGAAAGVGRGAALIAGVAMVLWGFGGLLASQGLRSPRARRAWPARVTRWFAALSQQPPRTRAALFGLSSALLPCGWLYAFAFHAASTGSPLTGAAVMAAFWAGNLPLLLGLGVALHGLLARLRPRLPLLSAALVLAIGLSTVVSRANLPALAAETLALSAGPAALAPPGTAQCACHRKHTP